MNRLHSFARFTRRPVERLLAGEGFPTSEPFVTGFVHVVDALAGYKEEGVPLHPHVLICADIAQVVQTLPGRVLIPIGSGEISAGLFERAIKLCAPLARDHWIIYLSCGAERIDFGILATAVTSSNPSPLWLLRGTFRQLAVPSVYVRARSPSLVEVIGRRSQTLVSFSLQDSSLPETDHVQRFAAHAAAEVAPDWRDEVEGLFVNLLEQALDESHGSLVAVLDDGAQPQRALSRVITDITLLAEPIDLPRFLIPARQLHSADTLMWIKSIAGVVRRMIGLDGATIFSPRGQVLAFHAFIPGSGRDERDLIGGARTRAFARMTKMDLFRCVLLRSQDGATRLHERKKGAG